MWTTTEYPKRLASELPRLEVRASKRARTLVPLMVENVVCDLAEMYTNLRPDTMDSAAKRNFERFALCTGMSDRRYPMRVARSVIVPKYGRGIKRCRVGPVYNDDEDVSIPLQQILDIGAWTSRRSIIKVGSEIRHYRLGTPMGHQESCAKAGGVCLDSEIRTDEARERSHDDSERNLTCAFVDDAHIRVAYSESRALGWTRESAREYARQLLVYPKPLYMVAEPEADMYEFLETHTYSQGICVHKNRPWCTHNISKSVVANALHKFGRVARVKEFYACMKGILRFMCLG